MSDTLTDYRSGCPVACGLDILGDKWTLLIIRDLLLTSRNEFGQFASAGEGVSTNILSDRLQQLQRNGIINKAAHPDHGKKFIYSLTPKGLDLAPVIVELALWGHEHIEGASLPDAWVSYIVSNRDQLLERLKAGEKVF